MKSYFLNILLINAFLLFSLSCKKEETNKPTTQSPPALDNIKYHNITPDIKVEPVVRYGYNYGCNYAPAPLDSTTCYYLDVDSDAVNDFIFETQIHYDPASVSSPCSSFFWWTTISSLSPKYLVGSSFANSGLLSLHYTVMGDSAVINDLTVTFSDSLFVAGLLRINKGLVNISQFAGDKFIAYKKKVSTTPFGVYSVFGWIKINANYGSQILVKDFALNETVNKPIFCGQVN